MKTAYIGLGSNLGDSNLLIQKAWNILGERPEIHLGNLSAPYRTEPVGMNSRNWFINAAGSLTTTLEPVRLLQVLMSVERLFGRTRDDSVAHYGDRLLDLDLLLYEDRILAGPELTLPHPEMEKRLFVLYPLGDIAPHYVHPKLQRRVDDLLEELKGKAGAPAVEKIAWEKY